MKQENHCLHIVEIQIRKTMNMSAMELAVYLLGRKYHISAGEHRTAVDWAEEIRYLVDVMYPNVDKVILVMDNLNTHVKGSL